MTTMRVAGTLVAADPASRRLTYRLLPYGEPGRTSLGTITATRGVVQLPTAAADLVLNREHDRGHPLGIGAELDDQDDGLYASFDILPTTAGDDHLVEARAGVRKGISVELAGVVIRSGQLLAGQLDEAGAVRDSAFPSAQLVAADTGDDTPATDTPDGDDSPPDQGEDTDDDTDDTDPDSTDDTDSEADMTTTTNTSPAAAAPAVVTASRAAAPAGLPTNTQRAEPGYRDIVRFLADTSNRGAGPRLYAALSDITPAAGSANDIAVVPQWLGEVWDGRAFTQRFVPLITHKDLTGMTVQGWKWTVKPTVGPYAGNKAAVPSNPATTEPYTLKPYRIAGAHDIDRVFRDFGVEEFWTSYWEAMTESYARQVDADTGSFLVDSAEYVTPGAVPTDVSTAASYIVDGALAIIDTAVPTFAIVAKDLYRDLLLTRNDDMLTYLNLALGLEQGTIASFSIVPGDAGFPAGTVVVGAREAATVYELPGASPLRVEALNIANGGVDVGLFGYVAHGFTDSDALALVAAAPPPPAPPADAKAKTAARK